MAGHNYAQGGGGSIYLIPTRLMLPPNQTLGCTLQPWALNPLALLWHVQLSPQLGLCLMPSQPESGALEAFWLLRWMPSFCSLLVLHLAAAHSPARFLFLL